MWRLVCAAQGSGIPPPSFPAEKFPSSPAEKFPHASRFVFQRTGKVKVRVVKPTQRDVIIPSACGALMGLLPSMDDAELCGSMSWVSKGGAQALHDGNVVQALALAWDDWTAAELSLADICQSLASRQGAILEAFAVISSLAMVHLMQGALPHAALQVAHIADACATKVAPSAKLCAANALLLVACNATLALASIGGGGGLKQWLQPLRISCRDMQSLASSTQTQPSSCIAIACAHSVQGALQALHGSFAKAAASLDDALAYMRQATGEIDVALLAAPTAECSVHQLMRVRDVVLDSAVVTWNMCVVFCSGTDAEDEEQQQQSYEYALCECVKFVCAAGSDPGRPIVQMMCGPVKTGNLYR
jgi:hypothetical protein